MLFLVNFYHENTWEDIEDEFGDEWRMKTRKRVGKEKGKGGGDCWHCSKPRQPIGDRASTPWGTINTI